MSFVESSRVGCDPMAINRLLSADGKNKNSGPSI
jgi:hypothetical protein